MGWWLLWLGCVVLFSVVSGWSKEAIRGGGGREEGGMGSEYGSCMISGVSDFVR